MQKVFRETSELRDVEYMKSSRMAWTWSGYSSLRMEDLAMTSVRNWAGDGMI